MEKKLACYDIDGTLSKGMLDIPLVISEYQRGLVDTLTCARLTGLMLEYKIGKIDYETASDRLLRIHASGLIGQSENEVTNHAERFIQKNNKKLFREFGKIAIELLKDSHNQIIVTAAPRYIAEAVKNHFGIDDIISTQYEVQNGIYTGEITTSLSDRDSKLKSLESRGINMAFGDSESDIEMLRGAEHPFCISPNKGLTKVAKEEGWYIYEDNDPLIIKKIHKILLI